MDRILFPRAMKTDIKEIDGPLLYRNVYLISEQGRHTRKKALGNLRDVKRKTM